MPDWSGLRLKIAGSSPAADQPFIGQFVLPINKTVPCWLHMIRNQVRILTGLLLINWSQLWLLNNT